MLARKDLVASLARRVSGGRSSFRLVMMIGGRQRPAEANAPIKVYDVVPSIASYQPVAESRSLWTLIKGPSISDGTATVFDSRQQALRWKHAARKGAQREALDEIAHKAEREAAQERRQKKKNRKQSKKKKGVAAEAAPAVEEEEDDDAFEDDFASDVDSDAEDEDEEEDEDALPTLPEPTDVKAKMMKTVDRFEESLKSIRGAEPTPELFDDVQVNAYGSMTPLKAVGQVVITSPTLAQVSCFDPSTANEVAKAITLALDLNPQLEEGGNIRVPLPRISMETRQQTAKQLKKKAESCKRKLRQVRRKAMDVVKKAKDGKLEGISQDEAFARGKEIDSVTEGVNATLQKLVDDKMESIMKA